MSVNDSQRLSELNLIVVPSLFGDELYIVSTDKSTEAVTAIEQAVAAMGTRLQAVGLLSSSTLREALLDAGIVTLNAHYLGRAWDAERASDTWKAFFPIDAAHCRRGEALTVEPSPGLEDIACALYLDSERQYLFPTDHIYILSAEQRESCLAGSNSDTATTPFEQAPLGVVLLPRGQFGDIATAFHRAFNLMSAAGYQIEVTD